MMLQLLQTVMLQVMEVTGWYEPEPGCGRRRKQSLQVTMQLVMEETQVGVSRNQAAVVAGSSRCRRQCS